jgi:hypothetical protein
MVTDRAANLPASSNTRDLQKCSFFVLATTELVD